MTVEAALGVCPLAVRRLGGAVSALRYGHGSGLDFGHLVTENDTRRLIDRFQPGDAVEITFAGDVRARWFAGQVVDLDTPGIWVQLVDGRRFYVTNTRRIRPQLSSS